MEITTLRLTTAASALCAALTAALIAAQDTVTPMSPLADQINDGNPL